MAMHRKNLTIAASATESDALDLTSGQFGDIVLAGIVMPATVDVQTLVVQVSMDNTTWVTVTAATITHTASTMFPLNPAEYAAIPGYVRLKIGGAAAAARTYTLIYRDA